MKGACSTWWRAARPWLLQVVMPLAAAAFLVAGVLWVGSWARDWLRPVAPATVPLADLQCPTPPGMTREKFLGEVQYLAGLPDEIAVQDQASLARLRTGLEVHPWVSSVGSISLSQGQIYADITFREAVLYVKRWKRELDGNGMILPLGADRKGLFVLSQAVPHPTGKSAEGDVKVAATVAGLLHPYREQLGLVGATIEVFGGEVKIQVGSITHYWGGPENGPDKVRRLLGHERRGKPWDVRLP